MVVCWWVCWPLGGVCVVRADGAPRSAMEGAHPRVGQAGPVVSQPGMVGGGRCCLTWASESASQSVGPDGASGQG